MRLLDTMMRRFVKAGTLRIVDADGVSHVYAASPEPKVAIRLTDRRLHRSLFLNPELRTGEAYMDGTLLIEEGTLRDLLTLYAINRSNLRGQPLQRGLRTAYKTLRGLYQRNKAAKSRHNVAHHYDLSNELYSLFLDQDLNYSCAYFLSPDDSLEAAQRNKLRHVAAKLALKPGQKILDIGSGWGALSMYLAEVAQVDVTGVTLSVEQHRLASQRCRERGLAGRVRFELMDYRAVAGKFDRIVSVGMFEHVGVGHYAEFFGKISSLLTDDGVALLHSIGRKGGPGSTGPWMRKYIFPGGYSPALSETLAAIEHSQLWVTDIEILRLHYAMTLEAWESRFQTNRDKVAALLDERFCRMWEFYLIVSEFSFRFGKHMVFQIQLAKSAGALPLDRGYIADAEGGLPCGLAQVAKLSISQAMLTAYGTANGCLTELASGTQPTVPPGAVWLDLVEPTAEEETNVEAALGIDIPTREELAEIEASSRLYQEDGAAFMTANLIRRGDNDQPESSPVTFIIKDNILITIRYHHPQAFPVYVKRAMKPQSTAMTGWGVYISLLEAVVDRAADHLERVGQIVDETSRKTFGTGRTLRGLKKRPRRRTGNLQELIENIGEEGDFTSKMRESLVSIGRVVAFMTALVDQMKQTREMKDNRARIRILQRDIQSLTDHASFLSAKISFLLDAVLGLISIEQAGIIKIFSVAAVVFLPPTLVASVYGMNFRFMPELEWTYGYPMAVVLMVLSAILPFLYFKQKGWL